MDNLDNYIHCGNCVYPSDIGLPEYDWKGPAYANPTCPQHGEPHDYEEIDLHELWEGPMGVCKCGAYRDEHGR